jgi:hypothetical protein
MSTRRSVTLILALLAAAAASAHGAETAHVVITYEVTEIDSIETNVELVTLVLDSGAAGVGLDIAEDSTTVTYSITTNAPAGSRKIVASIDSELPPGVYLTLQMERPSPECTPVTLGLWTGPEDVMLGVGAVVQANLWMDFQLSADVEAGVVPLNSTTLTLTIVNA